MDLLLYIFVLLPLAHAWIFQYANSANDTVTLRGTRNLVCTKIDIPNGNAITYDPEGRLPCLKIYANAECLDSGNGEASLICLYSKRVARGDFYGGEVLVQGQVTAKPSISTSIRASATRSSSPRSSTVPPSTSSRSSSGSSLSGGAIAGIVVGVVCAVIIIAAVFFFGRRHKQNALLASQQNAPQGSHGPNAAGGAEVDALTSKAIPEKPTDSHPTGVGPAPGPRIFELAGQDRPTELASSPVHEIDTRN